MTSFLGDQRDKLQLSLNTEPGTSTFLGTVLGNSAHNHDTIVETDSLVLETIDLSWESK